MSNVQFRKLQQSVQNHEEELKIVKNDIKILSENYKSAVNRISELEEQNAKFSEDRMRTFLSKNDKCDRKFSLPGDDSLRMRQTNLNIRVIQNFNQYY